MRNVKTIAVAVALPLVTAGTMAVATPQADAAKPHHRNSTPKRITKKEFRRIHRGQSIGKVRRIVGAKGKVASDSWYSDGDRFVTVEFKQAGSRYGSVSVSFEKTERTVHVPDVHYYDWDGDGYAEDREDYGYDKTVYSAPLIVTSKSAYWF